MSELLNRIESSSFNVFVKRQLLEEAKANPVSPKILELLSSARSTISVEDAQDITRLFHNQ